MKFLSKIAFFSLGMAALSSASFAQNFEETHLTELKADGPETGKSAHKLIQKAFGKKSIETPDLYASNHTDTPHIIEAIDEIVGPHFIFLAHRDNDHDRDKGATDRQRNEIKTYDKSKRRLKGYEGETVQYRWKFKIDDGFEFSKNFTHFFQIKAKNLSKGPSSKDSDQFPVLTFTGSESSNAGTVFQLRHSPSLDENGQRVKFSKLVEQDMSRFTGQWIEFFVQTSYEDHGQLIVQAKNIETGEMLIDFQDDDIDMWRGESRQDFARPKWGIYRSLKNKDSLRSEEESARFADFSIRKGTLN